LHSPKPAPYATQTLDVAHANTQKTAPQKTNHLAAYATNVYDLKKLYNNSYYFNKIQPVFKNADIYKMNINSKTASRLKNANIRPQRILFPVFIIDYAAN
jgi:predicted nucleotide-binding protein